MQLLIRGCPLLCILKTNVAPPSANLPRRTNREAHKLAFADHPH